MFPKENMMKDVNALGYWVATLITFVFSTITKKTTNMSTRLKFSIFWELKEDKTNTPKHLN